MIRRVESFRRWIGAGERAGGIDEFVGADSTSVLDPLASAAHSLWESLFPEPARAVLSRSSRVIVSPDGPLWDLPFAALVFVTGWAWIFAAIAAGVGVTAEGVGAWWVEVSPLYGLTHPLGCVIFCWMLVRSTIVTLWQGGIVWRGTFYPLEELRKGIV